MCHYDLNYPEFYYDKIKKSSKDHICSECRRIIHKREKYLYISGKWEGDISVYKICVHCLQLKEWFGIVCGGYGLGDLRQETAEHADEYESMFLARGLIGMKRKWKKFKSDGLMPLLKLPEKSMKKLKSLKGKKVQKTAEEYKNFLIKIMNTVKEKQSSHYNQFLADYINYFLEDEDG